MVAFKTSFKLKDKSRLNTRLTKLRVAAITVLRVECHAQRLSISRQSLPRGLTSSSQRICEQVKTTLLKISNVETSLKYGKQWLEIKASDPVFRRPQPLPPKIIQLLGLFPIFSESNLYIHLSH